MSCYIIYDILIDLMIKNYCTTRIVIIKYGFKSFVFF